ncbi:MAG TPA: Holliday junction branch migration protein RuvA [Candidatus Dormibacteraeota bacterium]|nr:Holliday junction branch migration protein RuvA [Candidatus Dormibacteraeota bacterium]
MIASLRGRVVRVDEEWAVLEVGGVGYQVYVHARTAGTLQAERGEVTLQVHTAVREDAISLYGFLNAEELACFRYLLGVERIGPKAALAILSRSEWQALVDAIMTENYDVLAAVPGIGAKTARRIVLELKGRVDSLAGPGRSAPAPPSTPLGERAVEALVTLGFSVAEARRAVALETAEVDSETAAGRTLELMVRAALRRLGPSESGAKA